MSDFLSDDREKFARGLAEEYDAPLPKLMATVAQLDEAGVPDVEIERTVRNKYSEEDADDVIEDPFIDELRFSQRSGPHYPW